ncbi:PLC-like phosphodiesterase, partial [Macrolepiota fuliginosa MF-IS2]
MRSQQSLLATNALEEILERGRPLLGTDTGCSSSSKTCDWMAKIPDSTKLIHMNLPGVHDAATGNYSDARQAELLRYTGPIPDANAFRCQERFFFEMLNDGIRVFDMRIAYNPGNDTIGFYHSQALLAPTTRFEDVFFGFYNWLDQHPTEAVLISVMYESGTGTPNDAKFQQHVYDFFTTDLAKRYWVQRNGTLGTLGEARGKLTLLQRSNYALLNTTENPNILGIDLGPDRWTDNGQNIALVYNQNQNKVAYIEDNYNIVLPAGTGPADYIEAKFNVTTQHLTNATSSDLHPDQLFISFASAAATALTNPPMTPRLYALGDGDQVQGMDQRLLPWLKEHKGKRFGIVMLDFYDAVPGLVEAVIGL